MNERRSFIERLFEADFMPHGHCFLWNPEVLWMHVISDAVTAVSYLSIPVALLVVHRRRRDLAEARVLALFAAFIFLCGLSHILGIWTMWHPIYRAEAVVKAATALVSVATAGALWPLIPRFLALPDPAALNAANEALVATNDALTTEMEERHDLEERFRMLLESAPDAILIVDQDGRIELVNERCEALFGYARSDLVGQPIEVLVPESCRSAHVEQREGFMQSPTRRRMGDGRELFGLRCDGSMFPVEISLGMLETTTGRVALASIRDISDRLEVQRELERLNQELTRRVDDRTSELARRADELARSNRELEQFAYVVSHDLKSPMRGIASLAEYLSEDQAERLDDDGREQLHLLKQRAARMHSMIEGVLAYSRAANQPAPPELVRTQDLVEEVLDNLAAPPGISIRIESLPDVVYPRIQLAQIFQNLIGNAIQHMGHEDGTISIGGRRVWDHLEFRIEDSGVGIAPEHHQRVFAIFQTLAARDGNEAGGLGLAIVKKIVECNGGRISVESRPGVGSTFSFTVPIQPDSDKSDAT